MSRIAKVPVIVPSGVDVELSGRNINVKGSKGQMSFGLMEGVDVEINDNVLQIKWNQSIKKANLQAGTTRATVANMITGVSKGFERKLALVGVGYRAQVNANILGLTLGFSHPVNYEAPEGITIEVPSQTEIIIKGIDKQKVGQVASEIRAYRPPEPYKGKGVKYADEVIVKKEAKKK